MNRNIEIDTLRGIACLLLIVNHLIGAPLIAGLKLEEGNGFYYFNVLLENIRMPLFSFLGGYVFSMRGISEGSELKVLKGKFIRLYSPLIFVGIPYLIIKMYSGLANSAIDINENYSGGVLYFLSILYESKAHFWFLQSMLLIFLFLCLASMFKFNVDKFLKELIVIFILMSFVVPADILFFSFSGFVYLMPFFLFGMFICTKPSVNVAIGRLSAVAIVLFLLLCIKFIYINDDVTDRISILSYLISFIGLWFIFSLKMKVDFMAIIGGYSYTIYLYHIFVISFSRQVLKHFGVENVFVYIIVSLMCCVVFSKLFDDFCSRSGLLSWPLLGKKPVA